MARKINRISTYPTYQSKALKKLAKKSRRKSIWQRLYSLFF